MSTQTENIITHPFSDTSGFVYHYTTIDSLIKYILPQKRLRFSRLDSTNDPEEKRWHICQGYNDTNMTVDSFAEEMKRSAYISVLMALHSRILCFSQDDSSKDEFSGLYMGKGFARPRMWAQYAQNHTGACLVFNKEKVKAWFDKKFCEYIHFSGNIHYEPFPQLLSKMPYAQTLLASELSQSNESIALDRIMKYHDVYFFSKHKDWAAENEYRLMVKPDGDQDIFLEIDGLLECIILGARIEPCLVEPVKILTDAFINKLSVVQFWYNGNNYTFHQ